MRFIKPVKGGGGVDTSDATAISDNILLNRTAYARGEKLVGTMGLHEDAEETTIQPGESFQIIGGYHTGGVVKAAVCELNPVYSKVTAPDSASGTYGVHNQTVQLDPAKNYVFVIYYNNSSSTATFHFGVITKGVMTIFLSNSTSTTYNAVPKLSSNCILSYGPGYSSSLTTKAIIYEIVGG